MPPEASLQNADLTRPDPRVFSAKNMSCREFTGLFIVVLLLTVPAS